MISAAALAMSTAVAGFAYAAAPGGPTTTDDTSVVSTVAPATASHDVNDAPDDSDGRLAGRIGGGHGADAANDAPDDSDGRVGGGHGADDPVGHDTGDDHGSGGGHGSDDSGSDDHGSGGHGSDD